MNPLYEKFPNSVRIGKSEYRIVTDFREYIKLIELISDDDIDSSDKANLILQWFIDIPKCEFKEYIEALSGFVIGAEGKMKDSDDEKPDYEKKNNKVLSYSQDAPYIISGFLECYGIDLTSIKYMHWWKFRILLDGLNDECELKKRMNYRSIDAGSIKEKEERERILKIQRQIAITDRSVTEEDIGNAFGNMMW